ncbi:MAG: nitrate/sulfonate/bicarbonate ABC transporter ATP-binding protein [Thermofilum sp. ex4484_15]|nr:MAG: nitrate/sulfonate/bicarbonate ABC transporter ATP-binding protein [Thermofilum sp. ex4484_15]
MGKVLLSVRNVSVDVKLGSKGIRILDNVTFDLREGEFLSIIGPSGCGKSTLLRVVAGLIRPSKGYVLFNGKPLLRPTPKITMVFQNFALFPWLTALENVELALINSVKSEELRRRKAREALRLVGLEGFEDALPRELSGGMKQRVGFARALVSEPDILLMDEPFSNLDALSAEHLRREVEVLVKREDIAPKAALMVSHNVEEVVQLSDRVLVFSGRPGKIIAQVDIDLPRPRSPRLPRFSKYVDELYSLLSY